MIASAHLLAVTLGVAVCLSGTAQASSLALPVSHRAVYDLSAAPDSSGAIAQISGIEALEWERSCEGATLYQRAGLRTVYGDGGEVVTDATLSSWEAANGDKFRFALKIVTNGQMAGQTSGFAERRPDGAFTVRYSEPKEETRQLPATVVLPWQYLGLVLQAIETGDDGVSREILRGEMPDTDPAQVRTQILSKAMLTPAERARFTDTADVVGDTLWRVTTAVFEDPASPLPTFEITETISLSGIRVAAEFHYPDLVIRSRLRTVEALPERNCD